MRKLIVALICLVPLVGVCMKFDSRISEYDKSILIEKLEKNPFVIIQMNDIKEGVKFYKYYMREDRIELLYTESEDNDRLMKEKIAKIMDNDKSELENDY